MNESGVFGLSLCAGCGGDRGPDEPLSWRRRWWWWFRGLETVLGS